ncbi:MULTISPECIES: zinc-dependent alcohol dehydrogenase [Methylomonas]|uniref:Oxidoreductase n=1 Tax=Methylomonas denitrificans TaxID=1538553 RepID=A0A140E3J9_9GAMM|nr:MULTISPECIES: zinc-binding alcohol dehydrogenase [Methylomonas]AMK74973.1 oxidoreductase [Methylomonas denitrificans]OAI05834.1 oxidoreductase [Methylomonas methanica]
MIVRQLWFNGPRQIEIREQRLPQLESGQMLVKSVCSAISAGTEMLVYRGQLPTDIALDASLATLQQQAAYPLQYGYACVGRVEQIGDGVDAAWLNQRVFSFQPHASHFIATADQLIALPDNVEPEAAVFLANMETAVNLVLDGSPALGERVVVLGQGIVGLLLSSILARFPLAQLLALDEINKRRNYAEWLGVHRTFDPKSDRQITELKEALRLPVELSATPNAGADLIYEVSGAPTALNLAIELCSYSGRIVIGSWYGSKSAAVQLGGVAHRNRIQFISSQVSSIAPELSGRWDKARRFQQAWQMIKRVKPQALISHRVPIDQAADIYQLLDQAPKQVLQAIFIY